MNLGDRIAHLRGRRSQVDVAREAGIDPATLNRIERGRIKNPQPQTLEAIASVLGVRLTDLTDPEARIVRSAEGPRVATSQLPDDLGRALIAMRAEIRDVLNIAWDARGIADAAQAKADEALRLHARRGRRTA